MQIISGLLLPGGPQPAAGHCRPLCPPGSVHHSPPDGTRREHIQAEAVAALRALIHHSHFHGGEIPLNIFDCSFTSKC